VEFNLTHLKGGGVPVPHQIADQPFVVLDRFGALAIAHPRGLTDRRIIAHIVDHTDKTVIQHLMGEVQVLFHPLGHSAERRRRLRAEFVNFGLLFGCYGHLSVLCRCWAVILLGVTEPLYLRKTLWKTAISSGNRPMAR